MRRLAPLLAVAALLATGCGGGSSDTKAKPKPVDPAKLAAAATAAEGTAESAAAGAARARAKPAVRAVPHPLAVDGSLSGSGTVSLRDPRAVLTFDLGD